MTNKYKKEIEEMNRRRFGKKSLAELKIIGKKKGLRNVDQYKKTDRNILIERLVKGKQIKDEDKSVLLEQAKNKNIKVNDSMSRKVILEKITNPKLTDFNNKRLRELADKKGIPLRSQMTDGAIIQRLENPTKYYTVESLKRLARSNNIDVRRNINKPDLINILGERNLITTTPVQAQESNLWVEFKNIPEELRRVAKKKAQNSIEELEDFRKYIKNINKNHITSTRLNKLNKQLEKKEKKAQDELNKIFTPIREASAFKNYTNQYVISNTNLNFGPKEFLEYGKPPIINIFNSNRNIKTMLYLHVIMKREQPGEPEPKTDKFAFHSKGLKLVLEGTNEEETYDEMAEEILEEVDKTEMAEGSGWVFVKVEKLVLHTTRWDITNAGSYIELPQALKNKKAIINMKNQDDKCFLWCVLRALNPKNKNAERIDNDLKSKEDTLNMQGIQYPVSLRGIDRFEHLNPEISISVLGYNEEEKVYPLKVSKYTGCEHDIIKDGENSHYCLVKNISALLSSEINNNDHKRYFCLNCINSFKSPDSLDKHKEYCYNNESVKISMPPQNTFLRFKNFRYSEKAPFAIYADFESLIKPIDNCDPNPNHSYTKKYQKHEPISFCYYIECFNDTLCKEIFNDDTKRKQLRYYVKTKPEDPDAVDVFIKWLEDDVKFLANIEQKKMVFTKEDKKQFNIASDCWICGEELGNDRVRDHCHYTGCYRGAAHNSCNLKYSKPKGVPVFFHNLTNYDSHLFIKKLGSSNEKENIECIPNNEEKYITFTKNIIVGQYTNKKREVKDKTFKIVFKDSYKFMLSSLGALVNNLPKNGFKNISKYYTPEEVELIKQKGFYPYEYMDTEEKFNDTKLPPPQAFYSKLSGKGITNKDYKHACNVWKTFKMETFKDYHKLYNVTDVLLLADVFENFRNLCLKIYGLDPVYYYTAPGLSWDACLKITGVNLELLSDLNMLLMFEKGIRGGISMISNRYGEANNKYMGKSFNKNELSKYLMYLDANNLYGSAMSEKLPIHSFKWLSSGEMENLFDNQVVQVWEKTPCILEVDLEYPEDLHDKHNDYPYCPERVECKNRVEKLIPNLRDKTKYVIHYKNLIQCLKAGLKLKKIHNGIKFIESEWLKPYIDKNTKLRTQAKNEFEKNFLS